MSKASFQKIAMRLSKSFKGSLDDVKQKLEQLEHFGGSDSGNNKAEVDRYKAIGEVLAVMHPDMIEVMLAGKKNVYLLHKATHKGEYQCLSQCIIDWCCSLTRR